MVHLRTRLAAVIAVGLIAVAATAAAANSAASARQPLTFQAEDLPDERTGRPVVPPGG